MSISAEQAAPTLFLDRRKGARRDHLQCEKFGFCTADSSTACGICVGRRWRRPWWCGAIGAGVGAADMGSAGVGGGAPAGQVGGGPPAGFVGGGLPGSNNPAGNGSAGTGNPSLNAVGGGRGGNGSNTPGIPNAKSNGGDIGGDGSSTGVAAPTSAVTGGTSPEALSHQRPSTADPTAPKAIQSIDAEQAPFSPTGLATSRRKIDVSGIEVNGLRQDKTRRGERRACVD